MSDGATTFEAAAITCASRGLPPTSCRTFGSLDLRRVPLPAAMMAMAVRGTVDVDFVIRLNIPREAQFCVGRTLLSALHAAQRMLAFALLSTGRTGVSALQLTASCL